MKKQIVMSQEEFDSQRQVITEEVTRSLEYKYKHFPLGAYIFSTLGVPMILYGLSVVQDDFVKYLFYFETLIIVVFQCFIQFNVYKRIKYSFRRL